MTDYEKQTWTDGSKSTPLSAARLTHMEEGIAAKAARGPKGAKGDQGDPGTPGADGFPSESDWNALVARVEALEDQATST